MNPLLTEIELFKLFLADNPVDEESPKSLDEAVNSFREYQEEIRRLSAQFSA